MLECSRFYCSQTSTHRDRRRGWQGTCLPKTPGHIGGPYPGRAAVKAHPGRTAIKACPGSEGAAIHTQHFNGIYARSQTNELVLVQAAVDHDSDELATIVHRAEPSVDVAGSAEAHL